MRQRVNIQWPGRAMLLLTLLIASTAGLRAQAPDSALKKFNPFTSNLSEPRREARHINRSFLTATDSVSFELARSRAAERMGALGYAEFSLDSAQRSGNGIALAFHTGPVYYLELLRLDGLPEPVWNRNGFEKWVKKKPAFDPALVETRLAACLNEYQNEGYPFARFDSLKMFLEKESASRMNASLRYRFQPGPLVTIDTIIFEGKMRESQRFMQTLCGIHSGDVFDQSLISQIPRTFNNSIWFKETKVTSVTFEGDKATVKVKAEPRRAGRFDLLLGLLPPRQGDTKLQFTGLVDVQLVSPFMRAGEQIQFRFDKLVGSSQKVKLKYQQPYVFGSPIQMQFDFEMLKQDTTFLNRWLRFGGAYVFSPQMSVQLWYKNKSSSLISTRKFENDSLTVPPVLDGKDQLWGGGFTFENLDYRFNPTRGFFVKADVGIGSKKIVQNPRLHDNIYAGLDLKQVKKEAELEMQFYLSPVRRWVMMLGNQTRLLGQAQYFRNDLFMTGGSRSIRGFNENEFFASFLTAFTLEQRFILEQNSWLFVFADYAYLQNPVEAPRIVRPLGLGVGMVYETRAGLVSVSYAVGRTDQIPFQPSRGRIHIGLVNQF